MFLSLFFALFGMSSNDIPADWSDTGKDIMEI